MIPFSCSLPVDNVSPNSARTRYFFDIRSSDILNEGKFILEFILTFDVENPIEELCIIKFDKNVQQIMQQAKQNNQQQITLMEQQQSIIKDNTTNQLTNRQVNQEPTTNTRRINIGTGKFPKYF